MLVGKRVRYRFNKECDGKTETAWYSGKIISQVLKICLYLLVSAEDDIYFLRKIKMMHVSYI
jgi:hypothetical protein